MKVLNFLDMWHLTVVEFDKYTNNEFFKQYNYGHRPNNINFFAYFLKQPLKLGLITELFEITHHLKADKLTDYYERFEINDVPIELTTYSITYGDYTFELFPRTLDEFITDCHRAGIELTWRQQ